MYDKETLEVVIPKERIAHRVEEIAAEVEVWRRGDPLVAICVLKGAFIFFSDLVRQLSQPLFVEFLRCSSYGDCTETSGQVRLTLELEADLSGKRVLVVEDIVDTGLSMQAILAYLTRKNPKDLALCALIDKSHRRQVQVPIDFAGFEMPKGFLVGYGLDYAQRYRELPDVCVLHLE